MQRMQLSDIEYAVQLYNSKTEIGSKEIKRLFNIASDSAANRLKKEARKIMDEQGAECWSKNSVDTRCAYIAWHLDIDRLEKMYLKLKKLNLEAIK